MWNGITVVVISKILLWPKWFKGLTNDKGYGLQLHLENAKNEQTLHTEKRKTQLQPNSTGRCLSFHEYVTHGKRL